MERIIIIIFLLLTHLMRQKFVKHIKYILETREPGNYSTADLKYTHFYTRIYCTVVECKQTLLLNLFSNKEFV